MRKNLFYLMMFLIPLLGFGQLLQQDFEGATFPPSGWTLDQTNANETWQTGAWETGLAAIVNYDSSLGNQDEWLISPSISLVGAEDPYLSFTIGYSYYWAVNPNDNYDAFVKVSTDNGLTWTILWEDADEATFDPFIPINKSLSLGDYIGQADVKIAFQYSGADGAALYLDNVSVGEGAVILYCTPTAGSNDATGITNVTFGDINNSTDTTGAYNDYTSESTTVAVGDEVDLGVRVNTAGSSYTVWASAWIDWDNDGDFTDETVINLGSVMGTADGETDASPQTVTIPDVPEGEYRMRVRAVYGTSAVPAPCGAQSYSEAEDYTIVVGGDTDPGSGSGDTCEDAKIVTTLPYDDAGNTADYGDDYEDTDVPPLAPGAITNGTGSEYYITGDDVVYSYTPTEDQLISVSTTNDNNWIGLWAFTGCPFTSTVGYHTATSGGTRLIQGLPVTAGETYYFVVSTWPAPQSTDYTIHIEVVQACEGTPEGGTATVDPTSGPSGAAAHFTVSGYSTDIGVSYDWEYSVNGGDWQSVGTGADDVNLTVTGEQGDEFTVRYAVTCSVSSETAYSNEVTYTIDNSDCTPTFTSATDYIDNFQLEDIQNMASGFSDGGYGDFTTMSTDLNADQTYTASLTSSSGSGNHAAAAWIDFNDDDIFDVSERVGIADGIGPNATVDLSITIPAGVSGEHRLRVVYQYGTGLVGEDIEPCASASFGEGEDYTVNIIGDEPPAEGCLDANPDLPQWPTSTFIPSCNGTAEVIATNCWTGEYSMVQVTAGTEYIFSSSVDTDLVTISDESGTTVYTAGIATVTWTAPADEVVRFYLHLDEDCDWGDDVNRSRMVQCGELPPPQEGCLTASFGQYPSATFVPACFGTPQSVTDVGYAGEYSMVQVTAGTEYIFSSSIATDFITIGNEAGDTVIAYGQSPLTWTADADQLVRFYTHVNDSCLEDTGLRSRMVQCGEVPPPPSACEDFVVLSNNLENGLFFEGDTAQHMAADVPVADEGFTVYGMEPTVIGEASTFTFIFYDDAGGVPGTQIDQKEGTVFGVVETGENFGYTFYKYTVGFDSPIDFEANTTYWIEIQSDAVAWETESVTTLGNDDVFYNINVGEGVWTPTGGDQYVFNLVCEPLSISDMNSFNFTYYPNPVKDYLTIDAKKNIEMISVHNLAGQSVLQNVKAVDGKVNMSSLSPGVYVFRVTLEGGQVETFKIIKK